MQVFLTTPWVPPEWIQSHGHQPRGIWWLPSLGLQSCSLGAGTCAWAQSVCSLAANQSDSAIVFSSQCDQLRRGFDAFAGARQDRTFLFNLPATWQNPAAVQIFEYELARLREFLLHLGGKAPVNEQLHLAIGAYASARATLVKAADLHHGRLYAEAVAAFHWDGSLRLGSLGVPPSPPPARLVPLALIGGPLPRTCWPLFDHLECSGGLVVVNGTEAGERSLGLQSAPSIAATPARTPEQQVAQQSLDRCVDIFQRPNTRFYAWLSERITARKVRGILLWHYVGCDLWRAETQSLREAFGLPLLALEPDESGGISTRMRNRIEAFLETLR